MAYLKTEPRTCPYKQDVSTPNSNRSGQIPHEPGLGETEELQKALARHGGAAGATLQTRTWLAAGAASARFFGFTPVPSISTLTCWVLRSNLPLVADA